MAQFTTEACIDGVTGKYGKRSRTVMRQKHYKYPDGRIFGCGPKEMYEKEKRDYRHAPRTEAERAQHKRWTEACREARAIEKDTAHPRYEEMKARHLAQLDGKPDPAVGEKRICQFGNFVRAVLVKESSEFTFAQLCK